MKRLVHLSDLHFGRDRPELMRPLLAKVNGLAPDLVAISGDLTQRARASQFRAARAFIDAIDAPVLVVPGNHDTPLYNVVERLVRPFAKYRKYINRNLNPVVHTPEATVLGINTVDPLAVQRGWFSWNDIRRVKRGFAETSPGALRIAVLHHPLQHRPGDTKTLMRGAAGAIHTLGAAGTDIVLSGHLHSWRAETFVELDDTRAVLQVHAGTGLSNRVRGEPNDFNLLLLRGSEVQVDRFAAGAAARDFEHIQSATFLQAANGWRLKAGDPQVQPE
ncbi:MULTISPECIES: metallophosphoesterase family protein [unclassified Marinovum]